mmetsp:Transcript_6555/g.18570  ORF Transcript_6555/g.18570 Transcript_6555/m.18570 type:complete len:268 (+) Transcript_6555:395-1198(+)
MACSAAAPSGAPVTAPAKAVSSCTSRSNADVLLSVMSCRSQSISASSSVRSSTLFPLTLFLARLREDEDVRSASESLVLLRSERVARCFCSSASSTLRSSFPISALISSRMLSRSISSASAYCSWIACFSYSKMPWALILLRSRQVPAASSCCHFFASSFFTLLPSRVVSPSRIRCFSRCRSRTRWRNPSTLASTSRSASFASCAGGSRRSTSLMVAGWGREKTGSRSNPTPSSTASGRGIPAPPRRNRLRGEPGMGRGTRMGLGTS